MLRIPTYVAHSRIAGMGLFAAADLPAGSIIWEYVDGVDRRLSATELAAIPEGLRTWLSHYLYLDEAGFYVLCGDNAKYMNHADDPNCDDSGQVYTVTRRAIAAGEELTCDYRLFDEDSKLNGSPSFLPAA